ncbi:sulfatase family protein [Saccharicrinis aurantiacus]|uniref:sulfatase family protein n=1 Tax=Saccharicrinis aurantiacus TaxID=1849719 RepID=UPI0024917BBB|nr:sulfatase [Saccharicrinis aurantiacus]
MKNTRIQLHYSSLAIIVVLFILSSCTNNNSKLKVSEEPDYSHLKLDEKPNILWLVTEDMGAYIPSFGDSTIETPNLSKLAAEGIRYPNMYSVSGVCAPSRSAIATGMYPTSIGTNNMRTNSDMHITGLPAYEGVPNTEVKMLSELLRRQGYYCSNNYKTDYQFKAPVTAWDESSPYAHWRNKKEGQPFFAVFNFTETHESGLFEPYGFRKIETRHYHSGDRSYKWGPKRLSEENTSKHLSKDTKFTIPPYLVDDEITRRDMWKLYNNIAEMDCQIGVVLKQLEEDGLLDNTIIFFYGDHGGPLPREKRLIYDSGLNTPLIIRFPKQQEAGKIDKQLLSFVDFAPTLLSLTGIEPPEYLQGQAFLGKYTEPEKRKYIYGAADRFDEITDAIRAVRDSRFKYIRNYRPEQGYYLPISYREQIPSMQELLRLRDLGQLNSIQAQWFRESKPTEELFDCESDPYELNNIASLPQYKDKLVELRVEMDRWIRNVGDRPNLPERELINDLWGGSDTQPVTQKPKVQIENQLVTITCATEGASIGYRIVKKGKKAQGPWEIYTNPFNVPQGITLQVQAHRIGFKANTVTQIINYK